MSFPIPGLIKSLFSTFPLYVYPSSPSPPAASEGSKGGGLRTLLAVDNDRRSLAAEVFLLGRSVAFDIIHVDADGGNIFYDDGQEIPLDRLAQKYGSLDDDDDDDENAETARLREAVLSVLSSVQSGLVGREREIACLNELTDVMDDRLRAEVYALIHLATTPHSPPSSAAAAAAAERAILKRHGGRLIALHDRLHAALPLTSSTKRVYKEEES